MRDLFLANGLRFTLTDVGIDKFGKVFVGGVDVGEYLIAERLALWYDGGRDRNWIGIHPTRVLYGRCGDIMWIKSVTLDVWINMNHITHFAIRVTGNPHR